MLPVTTLAAPVQVEVHVQRPAKVRRPYLYALDPIRVVTALSVLAVHVFEFSSTLNASTLGAQVQVGASSALHFTREVFIFTTAFVLVYTYAGSSFNLKTFVRRRTITVVVPYVLWSIVYIWFNATLQGTTLSVRGFALSSLKAVLMGSASYQLYFILLSIQFYMLFPVLLLVLPRLRRYARLVLTLSFVVELVMLSFSFVFLENLHAAPLFSSVWIARIDFYQDRIVFVYQFYFLLGALLALHVERVCAFLLAHGRAIAVAFALTLGAFWLNVVFAVGLGHDTVEYATAVLQPAMVPYTLVVLAFLGWLAVRWAPPPHAGAAAAKPRGARLWNTLAESTFGIYLVHPLFLTLAMAFVAPALPALLPVPLRVLVLLLLVASVSVGASVALLRTPGLSGLVGRPSPLPTLAQVRQGLAHARGRAASLWQRAQISVWAQTADDAADEALVLAGISASLLPVLAAPTKPLNGGNSLPGPRVTPQAVGFQPTVGSISPGDYGGVQAQEQNAARSEGRIAGESDAPAPGGAAPRFMAGERERRQRRARELKRDGWRQREIATELGISRSTVSNWLKNGKFGEIQEQTSDVAHDVSEEGALGSDHVGGGHDSVAGTVSRADATMPRRNSGNTYEE